MLWLERTDGDPREDRDCEPAALFANLQNHVAVVSAERFLYFHPDDDPVRPEATMPRPRPRRIAVHGEIDFANRDRPLEDVLEQIANHTDRSGNTLIPDYTWPIQGYLPHSD